MGTGLKRGPGRLAAPARADRGCRNLSWFVGDRIGPIGWALWMSILRLSGVQGTTLVALARVGMGPCGVLQVVPAQRWTYPPPLIAVTLKTWARLKPNPLRIAAGGWS